MIPIKIQCGCGQRYAFDFEPAGGQLPSPLACPVCSADGTAAANAAIAQHLTAQAAAATADQPGLRVAAPASSESAAASGVRRSAALLPGQMDRGRAESEARAKISWGDPPEEATRFLMRNGFSAQEASVLVQEMFQERVATIRSNGIKKIMVGIGFICVPVVAFFIFNSIGVIPLKLFAITVAVGLWGAWMVLKGISMIIAPKSEPGDVAEQ